MTAGLLLQSLIAGALDDDDYVALASLDLSAAFDIVNVALLIKRLQIMGLPPDMVRLIEIWLKERYFYVSVKGSESGIRVTLTSRLMKPFASLVPKEGNQCLLA